MAGKYKQKRHLGNRTPKPHNTISDTSSNQTLSSLSNTKKETKRKGLKRNKSHRILGRSSISTRASERKRPKLQENSALEASENILQSSSADSDTGSQISKRRRRETRTSTSEQTPEPQGTSSTSFESSRSRRRRSGVCHLEESKGKIPEPVMASSSFHRVTSDSVIPANTNDQSKTCLPSTSRAKRSNSSKTKSKFPQFSISSARDASLFLSGDNTFQGIVSSGMDISHFHNYLNSRSLSSADIGEQINKKLDDLRAITGDRTQEYMLMTEINQHLLVSYEDSLNSLRVSELVSQVVGLIQNCEDTLVDLKNICYNVLLHLIEALPRSSDYLVSSLGMFLNKISNLFDFDSLEQIINVIERISRRHGQEVLQSGAFTIILNYYDFLTAPQQLTILNMISQCFTNLKPADFNYITDGIENLTSRLKQSEPKCVEKVIQCFVRLVNAFQNEESKLKRIASNNLFANLQELLISSPPVISDFHEIIQMMAVLCANCSDLAVDLIKQNITQTILCVFNSVNGDSSTMSNYNSRSVDEILSLINLISELMPPLPVNEDLFIINRIINTPSLCKESKNPVFTEHTWYWFNANSKQWISHPQNICQLLEKNLFSAEFDFNFQSNGSSINANLILMQQTHSVNGITVVSEIKRSKHQHKQSQKNIEVKIDSRKKLLQEQCQQFEAREHIDDLEIVELIRNLFSLVIDIYNEASSHQVRYKCMEAMLRMIYPTSHKVLNSVLNKASLSSLMASLLTSQDSSIIINAIQLGSLLKKLPASLIVNFKKEGVLYQLNKMLAFWREKSCEPIQQPASSSKVLMSNESSSSMIVSAPSGVLDGSGVDHIDEDTTQCIQRRRNNHEQNPESVAANTSSTNNPTQRFTNWVKRTTCIGRPVSSEVNMHSSVRFRRQKADVDNALDMSVKPDQSSSSSKRINQIMSMLNLNSSLSSVYSPFEPKNNDSKLYENQNKEFYFKQWILKFGSKLDSDWKNIGDLSLDEKVMSVNVTNGQNQKKDIVYYLKEVVCGLRSENLTLVRKALMLYSDLLTNDYYISVFEMECSGVNEALLDFFTASKGSDVNHENFLLFLQIFVHDHSKAKLYDSKAITYVKKPLVSLVTHLLMCLHQQEQFHVKIFQLPSNHTNAVDNINSRSVIQSRFSLTQALTEAVLGRISAHKRLDNSSRHLDSNIIEARLLPSILLEPSLSRGKYTEVQCHFTIYPYDVHSRDTEFGYEKWNNGDLISFNTSFNVFIDILVTVSNVEKIVMREISKHRRINKRFGAALSKELASINDSSDSDDDYDCEGMNESLLSTEIDYQDDISDLADASYTVNTSGKKFDSDKIPTFNPFNLTSSNPISKSRKTRNKQSISKISNPTPSTKVINNPLTKIREGGLKALANRRNTRQSQHDSESQAVTPSTSSGCSSSLIMNPSSKSVESVSGKLIAESIIKPLAKIQIFIGDTLLPSDMTLYQALRRYSSPVTDFVSNCTDGKTDQELEETINQLIWKSQHNIYYRPVSSIYCHTVASHGGLKSFNADSISTLNFMTSLLSQPQNKSLISHDNLMKPHSTITINASPSFQPSFSTNLSSISTRQRTIQKKSLPHLSITVDSEHAFPISHSLRHKRRRKNNTDSNPSIGRNSSNSQKILIDNMSNKLPYPTLIDYPTIFEPIPNVNNNKLCVGGSAVSSNTVTTVIPSHESSRNMSTKLETTLALLRCLNALNRHWHVLNFNLNSNTLIPETEFRSQKLTSKTNRQLQDTFYVIARNIPFWCVQLLHTCAFLFSLETRQNFFYLFNFDRARTLLYLEGASNQDSDTLFDSTTSEIRRARVQVNRSDRLLEESELLLKNHSDPHVVLEISFSNEAGFGLGPTNEFYTQVSKCLMKSELSIWYSSVESSDEYIIPPPAGLYPRPIYSKNKKLDNKIRNKFLFLGRLMARALLDCRKLDLPLNPVFYKWLLSHEDSINSADMNYIDPNLFNQLKSLHDIVDKKIVIESDKSLSQNQKKDALEALCVEDLQIVFVHPMYTNIELVKDGANRIVTVNDLSLYLDLVASVTLIDGVKSQMEFVIEGFDSLLPGARSHLAALFEPHEVEEIFCGGRVEDNQPWDVKTLTEVCTCDHGYTMNSRSIINLFEIMSEFTKEQRRSFIQFCTGTPRLPVGGFRALRPPFKIVNKKEGGENPDNYLPSVMTCQNFLKLPDYSSKEVMRQRLLYALHEGQNAFYLS